MIRPLRKRHWWMILLLAISLPVLFALALKSRQFLPHITESHHTVEEQAP